MTTTDAIACILFILAGAVVGWGSCAVITARKARLARSCDASSQGYRDNEL